MKNYLLICCLLLTKYVTSQNYVFDSNTKKPIESVNLYYNSNEGLITNEDGFFELPNIIDIDTLHISHIAYKSKKILLNAFKKKDTIFLEKNTINLDEVVIKSINIKEIMIKAINKIDENYINTPYNLFGFLRQSLEENSKGVEMIEVDFISYFDSKNSTISAKIMNAKRTKNYSKLNLETYGGVYSMIEKGDFVRRKANFLDINNINQYKFIFAGKINYGNLEVFKINFSPLDDSNLQFLRKGFLYIDSMSLAFIEINYTFDNDKLAIITNQADMSISNKKPIFKLSGVENIIKYKKLANNKWILSYLELNNVREGIYKNEKYLYNLTAKIVINNIKIKDVVKVKTNYNLSKDFNKAVRKYDNLDNWEDNYKFSLSNKEKIILNDINKKQKK